MTYSERAAGEMPRFVPRDIDQHYYTAEQDERQQRAYYELDEQKGELYIRDPMWGEEVIGNQEGDAVLLELFEHPVFQRLAAIEQLTLPQMYATMPGTFDFTRWEHVWGSVVFVRKTLREAEVSGQSFDPQDKIKFQLRTLLSDAGHTAFSHLGDWIKQTFGGTEDSHDLTLPEFLERSGINEILRKHNIDPAEVTMPDDAKDFVERPTPWLCTDRVDYGCREITRFVDVGSQAVWRDAFSIDEGQQLIMKNKQLADYFAVCFGIMSTEHHLQPVHRLQLQLFAELVKGALLNGVSSYSYASMHPYDALYTVDGDILHNVRMIGDLNHDLHAMMLDIARAQRRAFAWGRKDSISQFLAPYKLRRDGQLSLFPRQDDPHYLHPLEAGSWGDDYSGNCPQNVQIIPVAAQEDVQDFGALPYTLDMYLPPLKPRWVDPPYRAEDGSIKRVSDDPHMKRLMEEQAAIQKQAYVARIYQSPAALTRLKQGLQTVQAKWEAAVARPRTERSMQTVYDNLQILGAMAIAASPDPIRRIPRPLMR